ncbi:MAG TPA: YbhB/YbcL family Raf kinase inhibitor-like protein [Chitinophagaceae bacterium]|nr:YbhB/YbcL family Raf kinase inhibitor-like protein [Chitinophagaceae bacterium]
MKDPALRYEASSVKDFKVLTISSSAFGQNEMIPEKYTCDGVNISPPLDIKGVPEQAKCLALIIDDPDAPMGTWVHWVMWNIPVTHHLKENTVHGTQGINDFKKHTYGGPCPPSGTHRYFFKIYALDETLKLPATTNKKQLERAMSGHILAFGELIGLYQRKK